MTTNFSYKRLEQGGIALMGLFLIVRYTPFLELFGIPIRRYVSGISESILIPIGIIVAFLIVAMGLHWLLTLAAANLNRKQLLVTLNLCSLIAIFAVSFYGSQNYVLYTDEQRDEVVFDVLNEHGNNAYLNNPESIELTDKQQRNLSITRLQHPPLHYMSKTLFSNRSFDIYDYRLVDLFMLLAWTLFMVYLAWRFNQLEALLWLSALIFSFSFLRNYNFIRSGNELFVFIGITTMVIVLYNRYQNNLSSTVSWILIIGCTALAVFSKFSSLVILGALLGALFIVAACSKNMRLFSIFGQLTAAFVISLVFYHFLFRGSVMYELQIGNYGQLISGFIPGLEIEAPRAINHAAESSSSLFEFIYSFPFWYGPVITLGLLGTLYIYIKRLAALDMISVLLMIWIGIGIMGVLAVNPRAQYTVSMAIGFGYLLLLLTRKMLNTDQILRLALIILLFGLTETMLIATVQNPIIVQ